MLFPTSQINFNIIRKCRLWSFRSGVFVLVWYLLMALHLQTCVLHERQQPGDYLWPKLLIKHKKNLNHYSTSNTSIMSERSSSCPPPTLTLAVCVTWILPSVLLLIPVGNGSFCVCPMGRWFLVYWSRTSRSGPFVYLTQRINHVTGSSKLVVN